MDPKDEAYRVLEAIRQLIRSSGSSQRKVEKDVGFSRGYLSQLLARNLDLKYWHLVAILRVLDHSPGQFFADLYAEPRPSALESFKASSLPPSRELDGELAELYGQDAAPILELRERIERCERAILELAQRSEPESAGRKVSSDSFGSSRRELLK